jgi:cytochrome c-type biogenesis protein CcmH/NrfG
MVLEMAGAADLAQESLRSALELDGSHVDALNQLARILLLRPVDREEMIEAHRLLKRSIEADPDQPYAAGIRRALTRLEKEGIGTAQEGDASSPKEKRESP